MKEINPIQTDLIKIVIELQTKKYCQKKEVISCWHKELTTRLWNV